MAKKISAWIAYVFGHEASKPRKASMASPQRLRLESLEDRRMLSGWPLSYPQMLANATPNPHPTGDQPADSSQLISLSYYSEPASWPSLGITDVDNFQSELHAIFDSIAADSSQRPTVWGEDVPAQADQYRVHLNDNGMLVTTWTIDWGDGSDPQALTTQPWVVHQYPGPGNYSITVSAASPDGPYSTSSEGFTESVSSREGVGIGGTTGSGLHPSYDDSPPTLHVAAAQTVAAGQVFSLNNLAAFSYPGTPPMDGFAYSVDWSDGSTPDTSPTVIPIAPGSRDSLFMAALSDEHVFTDPGTYYVAITVSNGSLSDTQTIPVTVNAVMTTISGDNTCAEGNSINFSGGLSGDSSGDPTTYAWQMRDISGNVLATGTDQNLNYTFEDDGTYEVSLTASVDGVAGTMATENIAVSAVTPAITTPDFTAYANVGQTFKLPNVAFTQAGLGDTHTASIDWFKDGTVVSSAQVTEESSDGTTLTPGTISDSYTYMAPGPYTGKITLTNDAGLSAIEFDFTVIVASPSVTLGSFTPSSDGSQLQVSYTIAGATANPFNIDIYASPDGITPDQLLTSYPVTDSGYLSVTSGTPHTVSFGASFSDLQQDYHLIAVSEADGSQSTVEFAGGAFAATDPAQSSTLAFVYAFGVPAGGEPIVINSSTITTDGNSYTIPSNATAVHVRAENASNTITVDPSMTMQMWIYADGPQDTLAILPDNTVPLTNLVMDNFSVDSNGVPAVTYTISGEDSAPFSIGIYQSSDGTTPSILVGTIDVSDPGDLTGGGTTHTLEHTGDLGVINGTQDYYIAELDCYDQVSETSRADNTSAPLSGVVEDAYGNLMVLGNQTSITNDNVSLTQDLTTRNITVDITGAEQNPLSSQSFSGVSSITISTPGGNNAVTIDPSVTLPVIVFAGPGSSISGAPTLTDFPQISVVADIPTASESGLTDGEFTFTRTGESDANLADPLTIEYFVAPSSTAVAGTDYAGLSGIVTFAAYSDAATVEVTPLDADKVGGCVSLQVDLLSGDNYIIDSDNPNATVTIEDDDLPTVTIVATDPMATESGTQGEFAVTRNGATAAPLLVDYTIGGTAANGDDYAMLSGDVIIPAGESSATITLTPIDTGKTGSDGSIVLTLASSNAYNVSETEGSDTVTLSYDDLPTVSLLTIDPYCSSSEDTSAEYTVSRTGSEDASLAVSYTISVDGTQIGSGTATIPGDEASTTFSLSQPDGLSTPESAQIALNPPDSGPGVFIAASGASVATATAVDSATFMESVYTTTPVISDTGSTTGNITIVLSQTPEGTATVDLTLGGTATYGTDYTLAAADGGSYSISGGTIYVTFPAYASELVLTITPTSSDETPGKTVEVTPSGGAVSGGSGGASIAADGSEATVTIADDLPEVSVGDARATEGDTETFAVTLSHAMNYDIVVPYYTIDSTAAAETDYTSTSGSLTFAADTDVLSQTVTVPTLLDAANTGGKDFSLVLSDITNSRIGSSTGDGKILPVVASLSAQEPNGSVAPSSGDLLFIVGNQYQSGTVSANLLQPATVDGTFSVTSSPSGVVSVTTGLITPGEPVSVSALANGTATITLWYSIGSQTPIALATASFTVDTLHLMASGTDITNNSATPDTVQVGQTLNFSVTGAPDNATIKWNLPAYPTQMIGTFNASTQGGPEPVTFVSFPGAAGRDAQNDTFSAVWTEWGSKGLSVNVTIDGQAVPRITGYFNVKNPTPFVSVTVTPYTGGIKGITVQPSKTPDAGYMTFGGAKNTADSGVAWSVDNNYPSGWRYAFLQTVTDNSYWTIPAGLGFPNTGKQGLLGPTTGLDTEFPYWDWYTAAHPMPTEVEEGVTVPIGDAPQTPIYQGGVCSWHDTFTTSYGCQPVDANGSPIGVWVPLAEFSWSVDVFASWPAGTGIKNVTFSAAVEIGGTKAPFTSGQKFTYTGSWSFPQWNDIVTGKNVGPVP